MKNNKLYLLLVLLLMSAMLLVACGGGNNTTTEEPAANETVEEATQSLIPLIAENGMDWMFSNCSTTAQRGALDWRHKFRKAVEPVFEEL